MGEIKRKIGHFWTKVGYALFPAIQRDHTRLFGEMFELIGRAEAAERERSELIAKIAEKATHSPAAAKSKMSGAQLRRMNEKYNAQVARKQEPKSVSEILKEQANG